MLEDQKSSDIWRDENLVTDRCHPIAIHGSGVEIVIRQKTSRFEHDRCVIITRLCDVPALVNRIIYLYNRQIKEERNRPYPELGLVMNSDSEYGPVPEKGPAEPSKHHSEIQAKRQCDDLEIKSTLGEENKDFQIRVLKGTVENLLKQLCRS